MRDMEGKHQESLLAQLEEIRTDLHKSCETVEQLVGGMGPGKLVKRPAPTGWSPGECVEHLIKTTHHFLPLIDEALVKVLDQPLSDRRLRSDFQGWLLRWVVEPPARIKVKTTPPFVPPEVDPADLVHRFITTQNELILRLHRANGFAIDRVKIPSPFNPRVRYNLFSCFWILAVHERRHIWQAERASR